MGRKSKSGERQEQIVAAMYELARKDGLENVSIAKIAAELGMPASLVMHYFKTKDELVLSLIDFITDRYRLIYQPALNGGKDTGSARQLIDKLFSLEWNELFDDSVFYSCYALTFRNERIREKYRLLHEELRQLLAEALRSHDDTRHLKNPYQVADSIFVILDGAYYYLRLVNDRDEFERRIAQYKDEVLRLLGVLSVSSAR